MVYYCRKVSRHLRDPCPKYHRERLIESYFGQKTDLNRVKSGKTDNFDKKIIIVGNNVGGNNVPGGRNNSTAEKIRER